MENDPGRMALFLTGKEVRFTTEVSLVGVGEIFMTGAASIRVLLGVLSIGCDDDTSPP